MGQRQCGEAAETAGVLLNHGGGVFVDRTGQGHALVFFLEKADAGRRHGQDHRVDIAGVHHREGFLR
ncbi:hypothetical protein D3C76_1659260 [compost metagenome]